MTTVVCWNMRKADSVFLYLLLLSVSVSVRSMTEYANFS